MLGSELELQGELLSFQSHLLHSEVERQGASHRTCENLSVLPLHVEVS